MKKIRVIAEIGEKKLKDLFKQIVEDKFNVLDRKVNQIIERAEQIEENLRVFNLKLKGGLNGYK